MHSWFFRVYWFDWDRVNLNNKQWFVWCNVLDFDQNSVDNTLMNKSNYHRIIWVGRDPQGSSSPNPGSTQDRYKLKPSFWVHCPNVSWTPASLVHCPERDSVPVTDHSFMILTQFTINLHKNLQNWLYCSYPDALVIAEQCLQSIKASISHDAPAEVGWGCTRRWEGTQPEHLVPGDHRGIWYHMMSCSA